MNTYTFKYIRENITTREISPLLTYTVWAVDEKEAVLNFLKIINEFNKTVDAFKYWYVEDK